MIIVAQNGEKMNDNDYADGNILIEIGSTNAKVFFENFEKGDKKMVGIYENKKRAIEVLQELYKEKDNKKELYKMPSE